MGVKIGDTVRWSTSRKPLGVVVHIFRHKGYSHAVVERAGGVLRVARIYEALTVIHKEPS